VQDVTKDEADDNNHSNDKKMLSIFLTHFEVTSSNGAQEARSKADNARAEGQESYLDGRADHED
jgi:hypothetical protein